MDKTKTPRITLKQSVLTTLAITCAALLVCQQELSLAQTPSESAIAKEVQRIEADRKRIFNDPSLKAPKGSAPNIPTPSAKPGPDIEDIARKYKAIAVVPQNDDLYVFASFTMPEHSLKRLLDDAARAGATVVFRGFKSNSMQATSAALAKFKNDNVNAVVNPAAFTKYKVSAVPAIALLRPDAKEQTDAEGCALPDTYTSVVGDVTLDYALEHVVKTKPGFAAIATQYLRILKGRS